MKEILFRGKKTKKMDIKPKYNIDDVFCRIRNIRSTEDFNIRFDISKHKVKSFEIINDEIVYTLKSYSDKDKCYFDETVTEKLIDQEYEKI